MGELRNANAMTDFTTPDHRVSFLTYRINILPFFMKNILLKSTSTRGTSNGNIAVIIGPKYSIITIH